MPLTGYTWTKPVDTCGTISVALSSVTSTYGSLALSYNSGSSAYQVTPADYTKLQSHTFSITVSGTDLEHSAGVARSTTYGPFNLYVICSPNVGIT